MLKFKLFVIAGMFISFSANAGVGTRGGGLRTLLHAGETVNCVPVQEQFNLQPAKEVTCEAEECDAELLCAQHDLVLE